MRCGSPWWWLSHGCTLRIVVVGRHSSMPQKSGFDQARGVDLPMQFGAGTEKKVEFRARLSRYEQQDALVTLPAEFDFLFANDKPAGKQSKPGQRDLATMNDDELLGFAAQRGAPPVCGDWKRFGSCKNGSTCEYMHPEKERGRLMKKSQLKDVPCRFFAQGMCAKEDKCQFGHFLPGEVDMPFGGGPGMPNMPPPPNPEWSGAPSWEGPPGPPFPGYPAPGGSSAAPSASGDIPPHPDWQGPNWTQKAAVQYRQQMLRKKMTTTGRTPAEFAAGTFPEEEREDPQADERVKAVRSRLEAIHGPNKGVFVALHDVLENWSERDRTLLLGLGSNLIGLTRFKSVLIKRSLQHCLEAGHINAIESLVEWEAAVLPWLPPIGSSLSMYFEHNLCDRVLEVLRCMIASPTARYRLPEGAGVEAAKTDIAALSLGFWLPHSEKKVIRDLHAEWPAAQLPPFVPRRVPQGALFSHSSGICWAPEFHSSWPITFRGRIRALCRAMLRRPKLKLSLPLLGNVMSFLPPVCVEDLPSEDAYGGKHDFLDIVCAVLAHYSLNALGATEDAETDEAKQKLGETVWPLILSVFGENCAPKITGMFLQMDPEDLLLDIVNGRRCIESMQEAWRVWESSFE